MHNEQMDWSAVFFGILLGIFLLPLIMVGVFRLFLWILARKVKRLVKEMEQNQDQATASGWQVRSWGFGLDTVTTEPGAQVLDAPALVAERSLQERFLERTHLSATEWEEVKDRLVFVTDDLTTPELEAMGFKPEAEGTARQRVQGQSQLLGCLDDADVYIRISPDR